MLFKKVPILVQLIIMLLIIMVIPSTITVYYSTISLTQYAEREVSDSVLAQLKSNSTLNERELFNVVQNTVALIEGSDIRKLKGIDSYEILNSQYECIRTGLKLLNQLQTLEDSNDMIKSVTFIPENGDYVISSEKSIVRKSEYGELGWLEEACNEMKGVSGYWYPRIDNETPVITYLYRLNRLTTSVKGIIAVDIYEEQINMLLNYGKYKTDSDAFMLMTDGTILSHKDKGLLFQNQKIPQYISKIINSNEPYDYFYLDEHGERILCVYYKPSSREWIYGVTYPMKDMLIGIESIRKKLILLMLLIMFMGVIITVIYATRFSKPMRQLVDQLKRKNKVTDTTIGGNEIAFLTHAFEYIEKEEEKLYLALREREEDTKSRILHNLLSGEMDESIEIDKIRSIFPYKLFRVAIISIDQHKRYLEKLDSRNRSYQRYLLIDAILRTFPKSYLAHPSRYEGGDIAIIMNMEEYDHLQTPKEMIEIFRSIQELAKEIFKHTVSIGISSIHTGYESIEKCAEEAIEANSKKMFKGSNSILFWETLNHQTVAEQYYYPYENIEKITNYLSIGNLSGILEELNLIEEEILKRSESLSCENVRMIFNQLAGSTIKFMACYRTNHGKFFSIKEDIYSLLSSGENIKALKEILYEWYEKLIIYMQENNREDKEVNYSEQILEYLSQHYNEDILYEEVAEQMGISYSYLRKIVKETTGKSIKDYINKIRIDRVKTLLITTDKSISEIAEEVGYHNLQSITRYFKKFEGITPKEFKDINEI